MTVKEITRLFVAMKVITLVLGHGMLLDPASRNSAWRYFPDRPKQYTDNQLNCGGFSVQWNQNKGKCGVCGDAYHIPNPKYVYPGKYAKDGFITKTYKEGQTIQVTIKITSNHQGFFRFSVGKLVNRPITQEQLDHVLLQPDGSNTWQLHSSENGDYHIKLDLPKGLTCDHCVLQWWWTVGNNWGCDDDGSCGVGLGKKQETFVNCADIKITSAGGPAPTTGAPGPTSTEKPSTEAPSTVRPTTKAPSSERPTTKAPSSERPTTKAPSSERPTTKDPCTGKPVTGKPNTQAPGAGCKATGAWKGQPAMDKWCVENCALNYCPASHCKCS